MKDHEKKGGLAILLGLGKPEKDEEEKPEKEDTSYRDEGLEAAAEEILDAVEAKDATALVEAMKSFVTLCKDKEEE